MAKSSRQCFDFKSMQSPSLQGELRAVHLEAHLAERSLLTPEQIACFGDIEPTRLHTTIVVMGARQAGLRLIRLGARLRRWIKGDV
jgi:hypothetical protein